MSNKVDQTIVIILGILIILAFLAVIYGMYSKISISSNEQDNNLINFYAKLTNDEKINNIQVIDKNRLLLTIESADNLKGAIYDINNNKIIRFIEN